MSLSEEGEMDGGGGSRLVEAKFGQGEPRWVGMAAAAVLGGGSEREREPTCSRKRNGKKEGEREGEKSFCCPPTDVVLRPAQRERRR